MFRPLIAAAIFLISFVHAAPHRLQVHANNLTIFSITEGPDGFLWLAAADGLYRFDGFHYDKIAAFPFLSAYSVGFTRDGSLWCASFEGLARIRKDRSATGGFEIVLRAQVNSMAVLPDQVFVRLQDALARVGLDGSVERFPPSMRRDLTVDPLGRLWGICFSPETACWIDPARPRELHNVALPQSLEYMEAAPFVATASANGRVWAADVDRALAVENGHEVQRYTRQQTRETSRPGPLLEGRDGKLWFLGEHISDLNSALGFRDRSDNDRYAPISGFEDSRGHLWVAALGRGLIEWIPDPQWQRWFPEDFAREPIIQITRDAQGVAVATEKNIYRLDGNGKWTRLIKDQHSFDSILSLDSGGFLASIRDFGVARISRDGQIVERLKDISGVDQPRKIVRDSKGRIWIGAKRSLFRIEGSPGSLRGRAELLPEMRTIETEDAVDLELDAVGHLWVGYARGLAWLDDQDQWHKIATDQPITQVRSFALAGDEIWVTFRRAGLFTRLRKQGDRWLVSSFPATAGYTPVNSYFIKRDSRGWIWRGTPDGVFISDGVRVAPNDWIHLHLENGLAANEMSLYGFFEDGDGSVWIAGDEGLTHMLPNASWFSAQPTQRPQITSIEVDGRVSQFPSPIPAALASDTKVLRISVGSLGARQFREFPFGYRLRANSKDDTDWSLSRDGLLEFRNLPTGVYSLDIAHAGKNSRVTTYRLQLGTPITWTWPIGFLAGAGILFPVIRYTPYFERTRFRMSKGLFLLRRRFSRNVPSSSDAAGTSADYTGRTLADRYLLTGLRSRGGFSVVYEARDLRTSSIVAVKIVNRAAGGDSRMRDRFAHEVAALRSIDHPGVVRILDSWISPAGEPCLAMPFLDGRTLRGALQEGPLDRDRASRIIRQCGSALSEVHRRGIVHRDLKPENVMLVRTDGDEQAVIIDFGTAGLRTADNELAATTLMAGSFYYMAPERLTGHYSPASDVFSLAVIVLEMLTGKRLNDLNVMVSDDSFPRVLEKTLGSKAVADSLAPAFDPHPQRRPPDIGKWSSEIAQAVECRT